MVHLTILRDNREQKPWSFDNFDAETRDVTITTGDYTIAELCNYDEGNDTYHPRYSVERKAGQDFLSSITRDRDRFKAEIKRAKDWDTKLPVYIEEPKRTFKRQQDFMRYRDVTWSQIRGTVDKWEQFYNVDFEFTGTRERAQKKAFSALSSQLRIHLTTSGE